MNAHIYYVGPGSHEPSALETDTHREMDVPHLPGSSQSSQADAMIDQHTAQTASNIDHRP